MKELHALRFSQRESPERLKTSCSQPSIFSYFYSIVEHADRIARELDASAKRKTGLEVNEYNYHHSLR